MINNTSHSYGFVFQSVSSANMQWRQCFAYIIGGLYLWCFRWRIKNSKTRDNVFFIAFMIYRSHLVAWLCFLEHYIFLCVIDVQFKKLTDKWWSAPFVATQGSSAVFYIDEPDYYKDDFYQCYVSIVQGIYLLVKKSQLVEFNEQQNFWMK